MIGQIVSQVLILFLLLSPVAAQAKTRLVRFPTGEVVSVDVEHIDGMDLMEGDIVIPAVNETLSVVVSASGKRWANGVIPFVINKNMPWASKENIYQAMIDISYHTSIRFVEREKQKDYVFFNPSSSNACSSNVGRKGGKQVVTLAPRCKKGSTMHEILHALGFWHEQSREDRDSYVDIVWANITESKKGNFIKHVTDGKDKGAYDYGSIMHYSSKAFSKNGKSTIVPLKSGQRIGQRNGLSQGDINTINELYP